MSSQHAGSSDQSPRISVLWGAVRIVLGLVIVVTLTIGFTIGVFQVLGLGPFAEATEVQLEPTASSGSNPFMEPVGEDNSEVTPPDNTSGEFSGDTPGLYGEDDRPSCNVAQLVANLQADPDKAAVWADALDIATEDIPSFAQALTPVVLRADTAVTEHGYQPPDYVAYPAVLQAGTAVFVNGYGEPTVKCYNGNPLTKAADFAQAGFTGKRWGNFQPTHITYVRPSPTVIVNHTHYHVVKKTVIVKQSWCSEHRGWKGCDRPNTDHWCEEHPNWKGCEGTGSPGGKPETPAEKFCRDTPDQCDPDGIPLPCKGVAGPGNNPLCVKPAEPDPVLEGKAEEAKKTAAENAALAEKAAENARQFEINARNADLDATALEKIRDDKAALLAQNPNDPALQQAFNEAAAAAKQARDNAGTAKQQADFQAKAAAAAENNRILAEEAARKAREEADKAAGRTPEGGAGAVGQPVVPPGEDGASGQQPVAPPGQPGAPGAQSGAPAVPLVPEDLCAQQPLPPQCVLPVQPGPDQATQPDQSGTQGGGDQGGGDQGGDTQGGDTQGGDDQSGGDQGGDSQGGDQGGNDEGGDEGEGDQGEGEQGG